METPTREQILTEITIENIRFAVKNEDRKALELFAQVIEQARQHLATQKPFEPIRNGGLQLPMTAFHLSDEARTQRRLEADRRLYQAIADLEAHIHG